MGVFRSSRWRKLFPPALIPLAVLLLAGVCPAGDAPARQASQSDSSKQAQSKSDKGPLVFTFRGVLNRLDKKQIAIEPEPGNVMLFIRLKNTRFVIQGKSVPASAIHPGDHVEVDATRKLNGQLQAIHLTVIVPANLGQTPG